MVSPSYASPHSYLLNILLVYTGEEYIEVVDDINEASNDFDKFINSLPLSKIALHNKLGSNKDKKWPGTRPPLTNMARLDKKMDATWGRGNYFVTYFHLFIIIDYLTH